MQALVVYESMFGNTRAVAEQIADGLRSTFEVTAVPVVDVTDGMVADADLLVVGGPTHVHGMSRASTRKSAVEMTAKPEKGLALDPSAPEGRGLREWLAGLRGTAAPAAAFDTRMTGPALFTGRAAKVIGRRLHRRGFRLALRPESFLVDKHNHLVAGELDRAHAWGVQLAASSDAHRSRNLRASS